MEISRIVRGCSDGTVVVARKIAPFAALGVACFAVFDWPIQLSGQRFRWLVALPLLYFGSKSCWWIGSLGPRCRVAGRVLGVTASLVLWTVTILKVLTVIAGLAFDRGILSEIEVEEPNGRFRQIVLTRHDPPFLGMSRYAVARRFHCGPVGVSVPVGSIWAKYSPDVTREGRKVVFKWYSDTIVVPLW